MKGVSQTTSASLLRKCLPTLILSADYFRAEVSELWILHLFFNFILVTVPFFRDQTNQLCQCCLTGQIVSTYNACFLKSRCACVGIEINCTLNNLGHIYKDYSIIIGLF